MTIKGKAVTENNNDVIGFEAARKRDTPIRQQTINSLCWAEVVQVSRPAQSAVVWLHL